MISIHRFTIRPSIILLSEKENAMRFGKVAVKTGMGGSRNGRSRWERTEILKKISKKLRRRQGREEARHQARD